MKKVAEKMATKADLSKAMAKDKKDDMKMMKNLPLNRAKVIIAESTRSASDKAKKAK